MTEAEPNLLEETLAIVSERVDKHRGERIGEQNTKAALIVPVLRALGWDVEDLDEVHLEYRHSSSDKPVDYALMLQREPVLFIEAKGLDENLNERRWAGQVVSYATVAGVEWVVLTNGDEYRIYNAHAPVDLDGKLFRTVRVSGGVEETADALRLLTKDELRSKSLDALWRAQSIDNRVRDAVEALFEPEPDTWLVRRIAKSIDELTPADVRAALSRARIALDFPAAESVVPAAAPTTGEGKPTPASKTQKTAARYDVSLKQLLDAGLIRSGERLTQRYLGTDISATVEPDGRVRFGDEIFDSLSVAGGAARVAVKGPPTDGRRYYQTNGWSFWHCTDSAGNRQSMEQIREKYLRERSGR